MSIDEVLIIPILVIVLGVIDYAAFQMFLTISGVWALGVTALLVLVEIGSLIKMVSG